MTLLRLCLQNLGKTLLLTATTGFHCLLAGQDRKLRVEMFLNFAWLVLAVTLVVLRLYMGCRMDQSRRSQMIAIAILIAILFPAISVSDDLMAIQNPAEIDNGQRRDHLASADAHLQITTSVLPTPFVHGVVLGLIQYVSPGKLVSRAIARTPLTSIANRPPPAA